MKHPVLLLILYVLAAYTGVHALDYDFGKEKVYQVPVREHSIIVSEEGYYPQQISIFVGEKVKFFLTTTTEVPSCLFMPEKKLFLPAHYGKISEGEAYFDRKGTYTFYCPTGKIKGRITVMEKPSKEKKIKRAIASQPKIWMPKDE